MSRREAGIKPYKHSKKQLKIDRQEALKAGTCVVDAMGAHNAKVMGDWWTEKLGFEVSPEKAASNPYVAAVYAAYWAHFVRHTAWNVPSWYRDAQRCGGGEAAMRLLGEK